MIVSVRHPKPGVFVLSVTGADHPWIEVEFGTMDEVWQAARRIGEVEADHDPKQG